MDSETMTKCNTFLLLISIFSILCSYAHAEKSAEEVARDLVNPNSPLACLNFKLQYRTYTGDLESSNDQHGTPLLFQSTLPFPLKNGDKILFRPAIPIQFDQPIINSGQLDFDTKSGMGDISFDLAYATTSNNGLLLAGGIVASLPTATEDALGNDRYTLGPEFLIGKLTKKYILGAYPNHQWDVGGSGEADVSLTSIQLFGVLLPGGGWNYGTSPTLAYNHVSEEWTVPINFTFSKTVISNGRAWKMGMVINYYTEQLDIFGTRRMIEFTLAPFVDWFN